MSKKASAPHWRFWVIELDHAGGPALVAPFSKTPSEPVTSARTPHARCLVNALSTSPGGTIGAHLAASLFGLSTHSGPAPAPGCGCGWRAVSSPEVLLDEDGEYGLANTPVCLYRESLSATAPHLIALTPVRLIGRTLPSPDDPGLRAERLELLAIHLSPAAWWLPGLADQLAARFSLPVSPIPGTEHLKRWRPPWGWDGVSPW